MPLAFVCALILLGTGAVVAGRHAPAAVDTPVAAFAERFGEGVLTGFVLPTEPPVWLAMLALLTAGALWRRRWGLAATAVAGPAVALALTTWVCKPLFGRWHGEHLAYPSGHTVALVSTLAVAVLFAPPAWRRGLVAASAVLTGLAGLGLVGLGYHYATDVVGGAALAVAVTPVVARLAVRDRRGRLGVPRERREPADGA
ncbi:phosphatase PAP2 family protein [Prauserella alba]|uniref:Phosphatase PAP2 family protein n=1 Tax=Prauserella alba TaxID=176898 RepID=A0ABP4G0P3_9PSEU|nr:phosphatase PAP2 family protein [Prauserella alba]